MTSSNKSVTAYWRDKSNGKCEFCFELRYNNDKLEVIQEIKAIINVEAHIDDLLKHITNKVRHYIKEACKRLEIAYEHYENLNIDINLKSETQQTISGKDTCKDVLKLNRKLLFAIFDQVFLVELNAPLIMFFTLPDVIYHDTKINPIRFKHIFVDVKRSDFLWYRSKDKLRWQLVDHGFQHKVSKKDVGCFIKLVCKPSNLINDGPEFEAISKHPVVVSPELPTCPFEERHTYTKEFLTEKKYEINI